MKIQFKILNICIFLTFCNFDIHSTDLININQFSYVFAFSGLNLRVRPDTTSEKKITIPYLSRVKINSFQENWIILDNKIGRWTNVNFEGVDGWVFSGYLMIDNPNNLLDKAWLKILNKNQKIYNKSSFKPSIKSLKIKSSIGKLAIISFPGTGLEPGLNSMIDSVWYFDGMSWEPLKSNSKNQYSEDLNDSYSNKSTVLSFINDDWIPDLIVTDSCCGSNYKTEIYLSENLNFQFKKMKTLDNYYISNIYWTNLCGENYFKFLSVLDDSSLKVSFDCKSKSLIFK